MLGDILIKLCVLGGIIAAIAVSCAIVHFCEYLKVRLEDRRHTWREIQKEKEHLRALEDQNQQDREAVLILADEKAEGFPWLAKAYADYFLLRQLKEAEYLATKQHPARVSAEKVREVAKARRIVEEKCRIAKGIIEYWLSLFPFLEELLGETDEDLLRRVLAQNITEPIKDENK